MTIIWGLDLHEIHYKKFKSSYMFNRIYHLRRTKMIVYQLAMILCVCSESVGTAAFSDYLDQQSVIQGQHPGVKLHNNSFIGAASYNIFVGIAVAFIFGAAFFFDLFWPERHECIHVRVSWKISAVVVTIMMLSSALAMTCVAALNDVTVTGTDPETAEMLRMEATPNPSYNYRHNPKVVASVILAWPGWVFCVVSTIILFKSQQHDDQFGPKSNYRRSPVEDGGIAADKEVWAPVSE
ncbi:hypothetical protein BDW59DRAFT_171732 [Aspergillus cavernicola]|uniref:Uncharacterized protein n=1 Tax=Aspergillus cavernicola TaxID=176166 RepID=A0ABR4III4_9EURO